MAWLIYGALGTNMEEEVVAKDAVGAAGGKCAGVCPLAREPLKQQVVGRPALEVSEQMPLQRGQVRLTQDHAVFGGCKTLCVEAATLCSGVRLMHHDAIEAVGDAQCQPARVVPVGLGRLKRRRWGWRV